MKPPEAWGTTRYRLLSILLMGLVGFVTEKADAAASPFIGVESAGKQTITTSGDSTHTVNQFGLCADAIVNNFLIDPDIHLGYRRVDAFNLFELGVGVRVLPVKLVLNLGVIKIRVMLSGIANYTLGESIYGFNIMYSGGLLFGGWQREGISIEFVGRTAINSLDPGWTIRLGYLFR